MVSRFFFEGPKKLNKIRLGQLNITTHSIYVAKACKNAMIEFTSLPPPHRYYKHHET